MIMTWDEWEATYKPTKDTEYTNLSEIPHGTSPFNVWSLVDNDPNSTYTDIQNGYRRINNLGYFVTEVSWSEDVLVTNA
jgi:hypothetical protein